MSASAQLNREAPSSNELPALRLSGIGKTFVTPAGLLKPAYRTPALKDISIDVRPSEILAIVGESGSGKTTLGRIAVGLLQPDSGIVHLGERVLVDVSRGIHVPASKRGISMIFQDPTSSLNPRMRVRDIVGEGLRLAGVGRREIAERAAGALNLVGLRTEDLERYPHQFSGGQRQRIGIARAIVMEPAVLVADEPVSSLDVSVQMQVLNLILDIRDKMKLTVLFVTHNIAVVEYLCDRMVVLSRGEIVERGPTRALIEAPQHAYTQRLLNAVPRL
ncbi:ABC transporter ATP-binding protein [Rhodoplanes sp. Z2-YC6860]|uniref:ABC transporter ATP-binding protein n=1 Tax=Rhodoplanes sp. Z2-YC6860 TaxID=674703 RepID=UPI00078D8C1F|nr:ATP-binding cassette domain-containing protein [Rhodoplanes sp. Z2-YC6860]AMN41516.1 dipeptide transport system ATP-binding protein [Rhodoplanes sp. Z2-YC6860]